MRYILLILFLSGCVTAEQRAASEIAYMTALEDSCVKIGFIRGTEAMTHCKLSMRNSDIAASNMRRSIAVQNAANVREAMRLPQQR